MTPQPKTLRIFESKGIEYCLGHITKSQSPEGWCLRCLPDYVTNNDYNQSCPHYKPIRLFLLDLKEEKSEKL